MVAYFSSKLKKQIHAAFTAALLVFCLLGTQWIGLAHRISHAGYQTQALEISTYSKADKGLGHSSDVCHLFDALSLAGFIPSAQSHSESLSISTLDQSNGSNNPPRHFFGGSYQSRAPPTFIL